MAYADKWIVYVRRPEEQAALGFYKADFAYDEDGRLWRRTYTVDHSWRSRGLWTKTTPWHLADPYAWYPEDSRPPEGARRANTRALLPKHVERYCAGKLVVARDA